MKPWLCTMGAVVLLFGLGCSPRGIEGRTVPTEAISTASTASTNAVREFEVMASVEESPLPLTVEVARVEHDEAFEAARFRLSLLTTESATIALAPTARAALAPNGARLLIASSGCRFSPGPDGPVEACHDEVETVDVDRGSPALYDISIPAALEGYELPTGRGPYNARLTFEVQRRGVARVLVSFSISA